jgi:hypothetical protein
MFKEIYESIDINAILAVVIAAIIIPTLRILGKELVAWITAKKEQTISTTKNETLIKYIEYLYDAVNNAVLATNQTFVDDLKNTNDFTKEFWEKAFQKSKDAALASLSEDAKKIIAESVGDFDKYIDTLIQAAVKLNKSTDVNTTSAQLLTSEVAPTPAVVINTTNKVSVQDAKTEITK